MGTENISRRNFIRASALTGTALYLGFYFPATAKEGRVVSGDAPENGEFELNAWIKARPGN